MAISEDAQRNHDQLFGDDQNALAHTDPELFELHVNWAHGEVPTDSRLDVRTRTMVQLAAVIAAQGTREFHGLFDAALRIGITPVELKEIVYQAVPYAGMAKASDFLSITNARLAELGVALPLPAQGTTTEASRLARGREVQSRVVGGMDRVESMHRNAPDDERHVQHYLSANCFGDHVARAGLDLARRELLTFAMLATLGGCEPQLRGHVVANLAVGNDRARLLGVLTALIPYIGFPRSLNALAVLDELTHE